MQQAADNKETLRLVIHGDKFSGKSTLVLQALSKAFLDNWVMFHIPEGSPPPPLATRWDTLSQGIMRASRGQTY
jgi:small subunit ribosomal protein S29